MTLSHNRKIILSITTLLVWTLACRAATRLIIPDTPTPASKKFLCFYEYPELAEPRVQILKNIRAENRQ